MALPTILYNATSGSDTLSSGAGPATAINDVAGAGTGVHTSGIASTTIEFEDGTVDLSGVASDGSAVIFIDTAAGTRKLSKITAVDNSLKTVTTEDTFTISSGASALRWAIGGKRQTLEYDSTNKDWQDTQGKHGWTLAFEEGDYTLTTAIDPRAGDETSGWINFIKASTASARPWFDLSGNIRAFQPAAGQTHVFLFEGIGVKKTSGTWGGASAMYSSGNCTVICRDIEVDGTVGLGVGFEFRHSGATIVDNCKIYGSAIGSGVLLASARPSAIVVNTSIYDLSGSAINDTTGSSIQGKTFHHNTIYNCDVGIDITNGTDVEQGLISIRNNTIFGCTNDGIEAIGVLNDTRPCLIEFEGNIISSCGGYGANFNTETAHGLAINRYNLYYNNTLGDRNTILAGTGDVTGQDPLFTNTTSGSEDFTLQSGSPAIDIVAGGPTA